MKRIILLIMLLMISLVTVQSVDVEFDPSREALFEENAFLVSKTPKVKARFFGEVARSCLDEACVDYKDACIKWNKFKDECYAFGKICSLPSCQKYRIHCELLVVNQDENVPVDITFDAGYVTADGTKHAVGEQSQNIKTGMGWPFLWEYDVDAGNIGECDHNLNAVSSGSSQPTESPWPTFKGDAQRTGLSPYDTNHVDGTLKWKFKTNNGIEASPALGKDGTVYIGSHDGYLYALKNGELEWKFKIGTPKYKEYGGDVSYTTTLSTPAIDDDGTIYIASRDQFLWAIKPDGTEKWRFPIGITFDNWASPVIGSDGTIYITSSPPWEEDTSSDARGGVFAITPDGKEKWYYESDTRMFNSPALGKDGTVYVAFPKMVPPEKAHKIIALNKDGSEKWIVDTELSLESSPAVSDDGTVYAGSFSRHNRPLTAGIYAAKNGKLLWHFATETADEVMSTPSIGSDGTIYFGDSDGFFHALNPDGTQKWEFKAGRSVESSPAIGAEGTIYFGASPVNMGEPAVFALNPDGTVKWSYASQETSTSGSSPAIGADGTVYIGSWDGYIYAFGGPGEGMEVEEEIESEWKPEEAECFPPSSKEVEEKCDVYCSAHPESCEDYFEKKEGKKYVEEQKPEYVEEQKPEYVEEQEPGFFKRIIDFFMKLFGVKKELEPPKDYPEKIEDYPPEKIDDEYSPEKKEVVKKELCEDDLKYMQMPVSGKPLLSLTFDPEDHSTKYWGMIPFCAEYRHSGQMHGAIDFELKPDSKVYAAESGVVTSTSVGGEEGSGEIIQIQGEGFSLDYSGLKNIRFKAGDSVKKGDQIGEAVQIPHGEYHVHMSLIVDGKQECPLKYMDEEFRAAVKEVFAKSDYSSQMLAPCICNCESMEKAW